MVTASEITPILTMMVTAISMERTPSTDGTEWVDYGDGIGDNADTDDDKTERGLLDAFPLDESERSTLTATDSGTTSIPTTTMTACLMTTTASPMTALRRSTQTATALGTSRRRR